MLGLPPYPFAAFELFLFFRGDRAFRRLTATANRARPYTYMDFWYATRVLMELRVDAGARAGLLEPARVDRLLTTLAALPQPQRIRWMLATRQMEEPPPEVVTEAVRALRG